MRLTIDPIVWGLTNNGKNLINLLYAIRVSVDECIDFETIYKSVSVAKDEIDNDIELVYNYMRKKYKPIFVPYSCWKVSSVGVPYFEYDFSYRREITIKEHYTKHITIDATRLKRIDKFMINLLKEEYKVSNPQEFSDDEIDNERLLDDILENLNTYEAYNQNKYEYKIVYRRGVYEVKKSLVLDSAN